MSWLLSAESHQTKGQYLISMRPGRNAKGLNTNQNVSLLERSVRNLKSEVRQEHVLHLVLHGLSRLHP